MADFVGTFAAKEGKLDDVWITGSKDLWLLSNQGYKGFESRKSILCDILDALTAPNVNMIGVYGFGGIGKTTLMHEVLFEAKKEKLFDQVVFVLASSTANVEKIQDEIAEQLGLELCKGTESERARTLVDRLWKERKILIILDDICTHIDLETVGIPFGDAHRGCKILLTSRDRNVLVSEMHSKYNYCVSVLNKEEAWSLFMKMLGDCVEDRDLESIAIQVANECGGLPLAIVIVARALRNKPLAEWKDALQKLRSSAGKLDALVYSSIELSYNYLIDQVVKSAFLLCGLLKQPYDAPVMDLLKYGMGFGLFEGICTMQERRDKVYALVHRLKDSCLLLDGHSEDWFSMHDIVRDVAISIASRDHRVITVRNDVLVGWVNNDVLKNCSAVSLNDVEIGALPEGLEYPQLEFFCVNPKDPFFEIPENFFTGMSKLRGLALSKMQLFSLPQSVHLLSNLQTLCLDQCLLGDISIIGNLEKLEILSFVDSDIERLPNEIGELTQLRLLDLSFCWNLKVIPRNVISKLTQLEELYMGNTSVKWEFEGLNIERSNASLEELRHLSQLTTLEIQIQDGMILPKGLFSKKLERYKIFIGDEWDWSGKHGNTRALKLKLCSSICLDDILLQLKGIEHLYLDEVPGIKNVLYDLDREGFPQLKHLHVQNNPYILCITDSMAWVCLDAFPVLESLVLHNLIHLEKICHGQLTAVSFCNLKIIKVRNCDRLKNVFSFSIARGLPQLQTITVIKCKNVEAIFMMERDDYVGSTEVDKIEFSQLRSLTLKFLPQLTSFYSQMKTSATAKETHKELTIHTWPNKAILEDEFDTPMPLFNEMVVFPNLETLELCAVGTEKIWCNQLAAVSSIQNLTRLIVHGCEKLKYLFPSSVVRNFVQLKHLEVCYCTALEEIVGKEGGAEASATFVFPKVAFLKLWNLPELRTFYSGLHTSEWPLLKRLEVYGCDKVKIFTSGFFGFRNSVVHQLTIPRQQSLFLVEKVISNLEELKLSGKDITMICQDHLPKHLFQNLKSLEVVSDKSDNFSIDFLQRFHNMEKLELKNSSYKEIFSNGEVEKHAGMLTQIKSLKLSELSYLLHIWKQCYKLDSVLQNLEMLEIWWCDNLMNLVPSSASFENLTTLEVSYCKRLKNLVSSVTAKSLVRLVKLRIDGCKLMTEIISSEGDVEEDEVVFSRLKWLSLECLGSLTSFCLGNCTFKFPSLEDLFVIDCPKMTIFSCGVLSTPRLREVRKNWGLDKGCWECNLNRTIQKLCNNEEESDVPWEPQIDQSLQEWLKSSVTQAQEQMIWMQSRAKHDPFSIRSQMVGRDIEHNSTQWRGRGGDDRAMDVSESASELTLKKPQRSKYQRKVRVETPEDDGYSWKKYGQKEIRCSKFLRNYYRCTHRDLYLCPAKKQVWQLSSDPISFEITYEGEHTCHHISLKTASVPQMSAESAQEMLVHEQQESDGRQQPQIVQSLPEGLYSSVTQAQGQIIQMQSPAKKNPFAIRSQVVERSIERTSTNWRGRRADDQAMDVSESVSELSLKNQKSEYQQTVRVVAPQILDDGHTWRKYGQKEILGSKFPRNYFRCSHAHSRGCRAKRQVQQLSSDPVSFEIAYWGEHTCQLSLETPSDPPMMDDPVSFELETPSDPPMIDDPLIFR